MVSRSIYLTLILFSVWSAFGRDFLADRYAFIEPGDQDGLSGDPVFTILQDKQGFLWLGTVQGLLRYDGMRFKAYVHDPSEPNSLSAGAVQHLVEDQNGFIWIGTWGGGLNVYNPETGLFKTWLNDPEAPDTTLVDNKIQQLMVDHHQYLWIGGRSGGLSRMELESGRITNLTAPSEDERPGEKELASQLPNNRIWAFAESSPGVVWIASSGGLSVYEHQTGRIQTFRHNPEQPKSLGNNSVQALIVDRLGQLWVGTSDGLYRVDLSRWRFGEAASFQPVRLPDETLNVLELYLDRREILWVSISDKPVALVDTRDASAAQIRLDTTQKNVGNLPYFISALEDRSDNLWLGGFSGLFKTDLKPKKFQVIPLRPGESGKGNERISAIHEDSNGHLWASVHLGGLVRIDRERHVSRQYLEGETIHAILADRSGHLWLGMRNDGLKKLDPDNGELETFKHDPNDPISLSNDQVNALEETVEGKIWVATEEGLNLFDPDSGLFITSKNDTFLNKVAGDQKVAVILQDRTGKVWAGLEKSLARFDYRSQKIQRYYAGPLQTNMLSGPMVTALYRDRRGHMWVGTQTGLNRIDVSGSQIRQIYQKDGLPNNTIMAILGDDSDHLWISTSDGLCRYSPESDEFIIYDTYDGLPSGSFRDSAAFRSVTGELFFGTNQGLTSFFPERVRDNPNRPPVVLTGLKIQNKEVTWGKPYPRIDQFEVSHQARFLTLEFAALDFTLPHKNRYRYSLDSLGADWIELPEPSLSLTNLDYGGQTLRIIAANSDGIWNEQGLTLKITPSAALLSYVVGIRLLCHPGGRACYRLALFPNL